MEQTRDANIDLNKVAVGLVYLRVPADVGRGVAPPRERLRRRAARHLQQSSPKRPSLAHPRDLFGSFNLLYVFYIENQDFLNIIF